MRIRVLGAAVPFALAAASLADAQPLRLVPLDSVATSTPEYEWHAVRAAVRSGDSVLVVVDGYEPFVTIIARGRSTVRFGRKGAGPGEYRFPAEIGIVRDTVWIWDAQLARLTLVDLRGRYIRTVPLQTSDHGVVLRDGSVATHRVRGYSSRRAPRRDLDQVAPLRDSVIVWRVHGRTGQRQVRLLARPSPYSVLEYERAGALSVGPQPFDDAPLFAAFPDGSGFVYVRIDSDDHSGPVLVRFDAAGRQVFEKRYAWPPQRITQAHIDAVVAARLTEGPSTREPGLESRIRRALKVPSRLPSVTRLVPGAGGVVWLRGAYPLGKEVEWFVIGPDGVPDGTITLPTTFSPVAVSRGEVSRLKMGDSGDGWLVRYRVVRQ